MPIVAGTLMTAAGASLDAPLTDAAPKIDGVPDEAIWQRAASASGLIQVEPEPGKAMTEDTEVKILHDQKALYIAVRCRDRDPRGIRARGRERDGSVRLQRMLAGRDQSRERRPNWAESMRS